jgi:hypothetical protein
LALPKRNSFVIGFVCALLLVAAYCVWQNAGVGGGVHAESPDGAYSLLVMAPLSPQYGGEYDIQLSHKPSGRLIRHATLAVPSSEQTVALRGGGGSIQWDAASSFADLQVAGQPIFRIWVP